MKGLNKVSHTECASVMLPVRDALDVISGKWKLMDIQTKSTV